MVLVGGMWASILQDVKQNEKKSKKKGKDNPKLALYVIYIVRSYMC